MIFYLAFKSAGIYPLDLNWLDKEENKKLLKLGGNINHITLNQTQINKWNFITSSFNYGEHLKQINYLDLFSPLHQDVSPDSELSKEINFKSSLKEDLISKKSHVLGFTTPRTPAVKRNRNTFEDTSVPRILNSDQRLKDLLEYNKKKETEENLKSHKKKKMKIAKENIDEKGQNQMEIINEKDYSQNTGKVTIKLSQRAEVENSLEGLLPITEHGWSSTLVSESNIEFIHDLILPLNFQTGNIFCRNDIVRNYYFLINFFFRY